MPPKICKDCYTKLGFFKKKFKCRQCKGDYCEPCFSKVKDHKLELCDKLINNDNINCCLKCVVFSKKNFQRGNLFLLETKHLSEFLNERHISTTHCREKYDLIDLIMEFAEMQGFKSVSDIEHDMIHRRKVEELRRAEIDRQMEERGENSRGLENHSITSTETLSFRNNFICSDAAPVIVVSYNSSTELVNNSENNIENNSNIENGITNILDSSSTNDQSTNESNVTLQQVCFNQSYGKWRSMDDIKDENEINNLSVIELKQVLKANFIDYRGCCEKKELMDKVIMLYKSQKKDATSCNENERDLCKICMDHTIDCVLLDCGHLVSCTKCGKRLAECPICRALVVRVVHIFRV
ncbi:E3 ubiquitin-protein ligase RNF34 isoform X2 [Hydra vulgaris]|uniref:E3 ubiquitin-protein ligase RNF34 isoform X2 n=1 Tax=Hydra vulgaris TaxID=6087 RepID=A0ABM4CN14_HYDVU